MTCDCCKAGNEVGVKEVSQENQISRSTLTGFIIVLRHRDLFSETYCGGYSGEDPPLPIPNREVKLTIADGTAPPGGRVGSCHFLTRDPDITRCRGLLLYPGAELFSFVAACFSTPVSYADSPFQEHADRSLRSGQASPLLQCSVGEIASLNRCTLNLMKTCTALALNPFLGAQTAPLYKKCSKMLHSAVAP